MSTLVAQCQSQSLRFKDFVVFCFFVVLRAFEFGITAFAPLFFSLAICLVTQNDCLPPLLGYLVFSIPISWVNDFVVVVVVVVVFCDYRVRVRLFACLYIDIISFSSFFVQIFSCVFFFWLLDISMVLSWVFFFYLSCLNWILAICSNNAIMIAID